MSLSDEADSCNQPPAEAATAARRVQMPMNLLFLPKVSLAAVQMDCLSQISRKQTAAAEEWAAGTTDFFSGPPIRGRLVKDIHREEEEEAKKRCNKQTNKYLLTGLFLQGASYDYKR
jgi:hypothetical protein